MTAGVLREYDNRRRHPASMVARISPPHPPGRGRRRPEPGLDVNGAESGETGQRFGQRLRELRATKGVSASELAYRVGVTEGAIRSMESGATKRPSVVVGLKIAAVLGVDAWRLATGAETPLAMADSVKWEAIEARFDDMERRLAELEAERRERLPSEVASAGIEENVADSHPACVMRADVVYCRRCRAQRSIPARESVFRRVRGFRGRKSDGRFTPILRVRERRRSG